jgi:hypothetical protein
VTYDFNHWRDWLRGQEKQCESMGTVAIFKNSDLHLPSFSFSLKNDAVIGDFRGWQNAFVDYEISSIKSGKFIANEAMIKVDDTNFEAVFGEFKKLFSSIR